MLMNDCFYSQDIILSMNNSHGNNKYIGTFSNSYIFSYKIKLSLGGQLDISYKGHFMKGIYILQLPLWLKDIICIFFSNIAFSLLYKNKITKILNKTGKCDFWTCQCKTPILNCTQIIIYKHFEYLSAEVINSDFVFLMLCHPTTCSVADIRIIIIIAISCVRLVNHNKQQKFPFSDICSDINNLANIKIFPSEGAFVE